MLSQIMQQLARIESQQTDIHETVAESQTRLVSIDGKVDGMQVAMQQIIGKLGCVLRQLGLRRALYAAVITLLLLVYIAIKLVL